MEILETKRNAKDDIIYVALADEQEIKDIYSRKAECRSDSTVVKSFIPSQFWERFSALNRLCSQRRSQNSSLKTQIRFGTRDLIVLTKTKGSQDPYTVNDISTFGGDDILPDIDLSIKWKFQADRPPRRRVGTSEDPTTRQEMSDGPPQNPVSRKTSNQNQEDDSSQRKRRKTDDQGRNNENPLNRNKEVEDADMDTTL